MSETPDYKFEGTHAAIVTPLHSNDGEARASVLRRDSTLDIDGLKDHVDHLANLGIGITVHGTTGESPTMSDSDYRTLVREVMDVVQGRVPVIAGSGSNDTDHALEMTDIAAGEGVNGVLSVTPYYNGPEQEGLIKHNRIMAEVGLPVVLYDIPGRSGRELSLDTIATLAEHDNIVAIKDATGKEDKPDQIRSRAPGLTILTGNDNQMAHTVRPGRGNGVISVIANAAPEATKAIIDAGLAGDIETAERLQAEMEPLVGKFGDPENVGALYAEKNPIGVKALMAYITQASGNRTHMHDVLRLPMTPMTDENREALIHEWEQFNSRNS